MVPADTDPAAHAAQMAAFRRMQPHERVRVAAEMSDEARWIAADGIRRRHPDYSERDVKRALFRLLLGDETVQRLWPADPLVAP